MLPARNELIHAEQGDALADQRQGQIVRLAEAHARLAHIESLARRPVGRLELLPGRIVRRDVKTRFCRACPSQARLPVRMQARAGMNGRAVRTAAASGAGWPAVSTSAT